MLQFNTITCVPYLQSELRSDINVEQVQNYVVKETIGGALAQSNINPIGDLVLSKRI